MRFSSALGATLLLSIALAPLGACSSSSTSPPLPPPPAASGASPAFHEDIEPIVQSHCQSCHHDGGIAPFPLVSYADIKQRANLALVRVKERSMPPWGAYDSADCKMDRPLVDDLRMSDAEIQKISDWVGAGALEGDPAKAPPPKSFPALPFTATNDYGIPQAFHVTADATDTIRCFPIDPGLSADAWVAGANVVPGDPRVVHHVIVYEDPNGEGAAKVDASGSYPCFGGPEVSNPSLVLAWAPGVRPTTYGQDAGLKLGGKSKLVLQVHYHSGGIEAMDATHFQLDVLTAKPKYVTAIYLIGNADSPNGQVQLLPGEDDPPSGPEFLIPAGKAHHTESMKFTMPATFQGYPVPPMKVLATGTHMHWAGVDMKLQIDRAAPTSASPAKECLLETAKYDFNWQRSYAYAGAYDALPDVGPNDVLTFSCTYDNSTGNKYIQKALAEQHRAAPVDIRLGETTLDEMCLGAFILIRPISPLD